MAGFIVARHQTILPWSSTDVVSFLYFFSFLNMRSMR